MWTKAHFMGDDAKKSKFFFCLSLLWFDWNAFQPFIYGSNHETYVMGFDILKVFFVIHIFIACTLYSNDFSAFNFFYSAIDTPHNAIVFGF